MHFYASLIYLVYFISSYNKSFFSSAVCPTGCKCGEYRFSAQCCLATRPEHAKAVKIEYNPLCRIGRMDYKYRWPLFGGCRNSWSFLRIQLASMSWPPANVSTSHQAVPPTSCSMYVKDLQILGSQAGDSGLQMLDSANLKTLLFDNLDQLVISHFTVKYTQMTHVEPAFFSHLNCPHLMHVELDGNSQLTSQGLGANWLIYTPSLQSLHLTRSGITSIELERWGITVDGSKFLFELRLSGNRIAHLDSNTFKCAPRLQTLDLSENQLTSLSLQAFEGLTGLAELNLQSNKLTTFGLQLSSLDMAGTLPNLITLELANNPLLTRSNYSEWWLSGSCSSDLFYLGLDKLTPVEPDLEPSTILHLPPVAWPRCQSIQHLVLTSSPILPCIPQEWLGLPPTADKFPSRLTIEPSSLRLCRVSVKTNTSTTTTTSSTFLNPPNALSQSFMTVPSSGDSANKYSLWLKISLFVVSYTAVAVLLIISVRLSLRWYREKFRPSATRGQTDDQPKHPTVTSLAEIPTSRAPPPSSQIDADYVTMYSSVQYPRSPTPPTIQADPLKLSWANIDYIDADKSKTELLHATPSPGGSLNSNFGGRIYVSQDRPRPPPQWHTFRSSLPRCRGASFSQYPTFRTNDRHDWLVAYKSRTQPILNRSIELPSVDHPSRMTKKAGRPASNGFGDNYSVGKSSSLKYY